METGESRTPLSIAETISKDAWYVPYPSTSSVLESSFWQTYGTTNFETDASKLVPLFLEQLVALGQTAQQLKRALGSNGHRQDQVAGLIQQLAKGGEHAP